MVPPASLIEQRRRARARHVWAAVLHILAGVVFVAGSAFLLSSVLPDSDLFDSESERNPWVWYGLGVIVMVGTWTTLFLIAIRLEPREPRGPFN